MKISLNYAFAVNSDISPADREAVMKETWAEMEKTAAKMRQRVDDYSKWVMEEPLETLEGFDYAITGISEYPRENVIYDYWKCVEVLLIRDGMDEDDAIDKMDFIVERLDADRSPIVMQPLDLEILEDDGDDEVDDYYKFDVELPEQD